MAMHLPVLFRCLRICIRFFLEAHQLLVAANINNGELSINGKYSQIKICMFSELRIALYC